MLLLQTSSYALLLVGLSSLPLAARRAQEGTAADDNAAACQVAGTAFASFSLQLLAPEQQCPPHQR